MNFNLHLNLNIEGLKLTFMGKGSFIKKFRFVTQHTFFRHFDCNLRTSGSNWYWDSEEEALQRHSQTKILTFPPSCLYLQMWFMHFFPNHFNLIPSTTCRACNFWKKKGKTTQRNFSSLCKSFLPIQCQTKIHFSRNKIRLPGITINNKKYNKESKKGRFLLPLET